MSTRSEELAGASKACQGERDDFLLKAKQMNFDLHIDSKSQSVLVKVAGLLDQGVRKEILLSIASLLRMHNLSSVIVDLTESAFDPAEPMVGALDLAKYMKAMGIRPDVKFAFIYSEADEHRRYFETVAQSEGFNLKYFKNLDDANAWLKG